MASGVIPLERLGECLVEVANEIEQTSLQILQRFEVAASDHATTDDAEDDLDLVQP